MGLLDGHHQEALYGERRRGEVTRDSLVEVSDGRQWVMAPGEERGQLEKVLPGERI